MRIVQTSVITENIKEMCIEANHYLSKDMKAVLDQAVESEKSAFGKADFKPVGRKPSDCSRRHDSNLSGYRDGSHFPGDRAGCSF